MFDVQSVHCFGQFNHQETVPFWCSFIRAPPLAKKTASLIGKETLAMVKVQLTAENAEIAEAF
jgi:hypothetical protein